MIYLLRFAKLVMVPLPHLNEEELNLLVSYSLSSGEEMSEAVVNAFLAANIHVFEKPTQLVDWVDPAVFDAIQWTSDRPLYLSTRIWDHQVVITAEQVRIYTSADPIEDDSTRSIMRRVTRCGRYTHRNE
jgi:hypothetical protein